MDGVSTRRIVAAKHGSTSMSLATVASSRSKVCRTLGFENPLRASLDADCIEVIALSCD
jgi:hypothetical protein